MRDMYDAIKVSRVLSPQTQTNADTAFVGQIIDNAGYDSLTYVLAYGNMTDADATTVVLLEESDDSGMSGAVAVDDADLLGTELLAAGAAATDDNTVKKLGYKGSKRYTRITVTPTGNNSGALPIGIVAIQSAARKQPVA